MSIRSALFSRDAIIAALVTLLLIAVGCSRPEAHNGKPGDAAKVLVDVVTVAAKVRPLGVEIEAVGTARAKESVDVTSKTSNIVTAIRFAEGDLVRRGSVLVELDSAQVRASFAEAEAALAESQNQFKRSRDLYARQALSVSQLDQIEATLKANSARVNLAQARLDDTVIKASFNGRTGFRRVSVGSLVNPGTVITTLDDSSLINLDFTVAETYLYAVQKGLPVSAGTAGLPGRTFEGKVTNIDSRVDSVSRSITVRAEIPNQAGELRPGMFMTVKLQGEVSPTLLVPEAAIVPEHGLAYVFVVSEGVADRREVRLGKRRPGEVEIVSGLTENERVVVEGTQNIQAGSNVRELPQEADRQTEAAST